MNTEIAFESSAKEHNAVGRTQVNHGLRGSHGSEDMNLNPAVD